MRNQSEYTESLTEQLLVGVFKMAWNWRVELALLIAIWITSGWTADLLGTAAGFIAWVALWGAVIYFRPTRRWLAKKLRLSRVRRRFGHTVANLDTSRLAKRPPVVLRVDQVPSGVELVLRLQVGTSIADLELAREAFAAAWQARSVGITRDATDAGLCFVTIAVRDPLDEAPIPWPAPPGVVTDCWSSIPVGIDEAGLGVTISLPEHNLLIGGEPGSGKSGALATILAACAWDPSVVLWLFDGKLVELAAWRGCAHRFVGPDLAEATTALQEIQRQMELRFESLLSMERRKVERGVPLHVVVIDELALYLGNPNRKAAAAFGDVLRDLIARGRAAGIVVIAATQKPSTDVVPSAIRDLFGYRWAMRCSTRDASDTVLGSGWATAGYSAADIDAATRGVGLLRHEGGFPIRCRAFWLDDETIRVVAEHGRKVHGGVPVQASHGEDAA